MSFIPITPAFPINTDDRVWLASVLSGKFQWSFVSSILLMVNGQWGSGRKGIEIHSNAVGVNVAAPPPCACCAFNDQGFF